MLRFGMAYTSEAYTTLQNGKLACLQLEPRFYKNSYETYYYTRYRAENLKVTVYLESLDVEKEVKSPKYEWSSFLSNVGGVMGLFTGFSVLSFFEILELLVDMWGDMVGLLHKLCHPPVSPTTSA